eukprot:SAG22_NODE_1244_length_5021_cov_16.855547_5_plen_248_part_00
MTNKRDGVRDGSDSEDGYDEYDEHDRSSTDDDDDDPDMGGFDPSELCARAGGSNLRSCDPPASRRCYCQHWVKRLCGAAFELAVTTGKSLVRMLRLRKTAAVLACVLAGSLMTHFHHGHNHHWQGAAAPEGSGYWEALAALDAHMSSIEARMAALEQLGSSSATSTRGAARPADEVVYAEALHDKAAVAGGSENGKSAEPAAEEPEGGGGRPSKHDCSPEPQGGTGGSREVRSPAPGASTRLERDES